MATTENNLYELLGVTALPADMQEAFMQQVGAVAFERALEALVRGFTPEQVVAFEHYLETEPNQEQVLEHIMAHHKNFPDVLSAEVQALQAEALSFIDPQ